jgi:hypothetical protein
MTSFAYGSAQTLRDRKKRAKRKTRRNQCRLPMPPFIAQHSSLSIFATPLSAETPKNPPRALSSQLPTQSTHAETTSPKKPIFAHNPSNKPKASHNSIPLSDKHLNRLPEHRQFCAYDGSGALFEKRLRQPSQTAQETTNDHNPRSRPLAAAPLPSGSQFIKIGSLSRFLHSTINIQQSAIHNQPPALP